jgi:uncharacterized protein DUF3551
MRLLASAIVVIVALAGDGSASAQLYDPNHPVCMHVYGELAGERMDCIFASLALCAASARGLPATCLMNPYYSHAGRVMPAPRTRSRAP